MKVWVTLEGREAEVTCHTEGGRLVLETDGRHIEADLVRLPDGEVYSLLIDGRSHVVRVASAGDGLEVELRGVIMPVEVKHPLDKMLQASGAARVASRGETVSDSSPVPASRCSRTGWASSRQRKWTMPRPARWNRAMVEFVGKYDEHHRFSAAEIRDMHRRCLGEIYEWAGDYRQVNVSKGEFPFAAAARGP